jgi:hypothetical protein
VSDSTSNGADNPGFLDRARLRRRLRHLEQTKEIALRDVGGLTFELHRAGKSNKKLVDQKLATLQGVDDELKTLRTALNADPDILDLHEPGLATCGNCGELIASQAKFCSECGTATSGS